MKRMQMLFFSEIIAGSGPFYGCLAAFFAETTAIVARLFTMSVFRTYCCRLGLRMRMMRLGIMRYLYTLVIDCIG